MVIKGDALVQVMGTGKASSGGHKEAGKDSSATLPGSDGGDLQQRHFRCSCCRPIQGGTSRWRGGHDKTSNPPPRHQGLGAGRMDVPDSDFDMCGKKGIADVKVANGNGKFLDRWRQNYAQPPAVPRYDDSSPSSSWRNQDVRCCRDRMIKAIKSPNSRSVHASLRHRERHSDQLLWDIASDPQWPSEQRCIASVNRRCQITESVHGCNNRSGA